MDHPNIVCYLETLDKMYHTQSYDIHQERQRPTLVKAELEEPIKKDVGSILELGYLGKADRITLLKTLSCSQEADETFQVVALEAVRDMLDAEYIDQLAGVDLAATLKAIAQRIQLSFKIAGTAPTSKPKNLIFLSSIRNALDQVWQVFELTEARWLINLLTKELVLLPRGKFEVTPEAIPMKYFKREIDNGIEMNIIPQLRPYTPVLWRGQEEIIDIVRMNSKTRTMFVTFAEK